MSKLVELLKDPVIQEILVSEINNMPIETKRRIPHEMLKDVDSDSISIL